MTAQELIAAAQKLSRTMSKEEKSKLVRDALKEERIRQEARALSLKMTTADLERTYSL